MLRLYAERIFVDLGSEKNNLEMYIELDAN